MKISVENHPCFNEKAKHQFGRIHLPVAPRCNIQCNYCNRDFDCVNESRPGVTSQILSPSQALVYLNEVMTKTNNIKVVGIAGPGDPFANALETMETLHLVRKAYPEMLLCVSTNGLNVLAYIDELAELEVTHITITLNAIDPKIIAKIYSWMRFEKRLRNVKDMAEIFLNNQLEAISRIKAKGIIVKINSIVLPGINDMHIVEVAKKVSSLGVDIFNCIPFYKNKNTIFENLAEPSVSLINNIRKEAAKFVLQMKHCARCRADAVGLLGEGISLEMMELMKSVKTGEKIIESNLLFDPQKESKCVAVATMEGALINQHLGEAEELFIYCYNNNEFVFKETRRLPAAGSGLNRWLALAKIISDCQLVLVSGFGQKPKDILAQHDINILIVEGLIGETLRRISSGQTINHLIKRERTVCGQACMGSALGCG